MEIELKKQEIPIGFCQCGCGGLAPISSRTDASLGYIIGKPRSFIKGHNHRKDTNTEPNTKILCACGCGKPTPLAIRTTT